jgi:hypothetical protein
MEFILKAISRQWAGKDRCEGRGCSSPPLKPSRNFRKLVWFSKRSLSIGRQLGRLRPPAFWLHHWQLVAWRAGSGAWRRRPGPAPVVVGVAGARHGSVAGQPEVPQRAVCFHRDASGMRAAVFELLPVAAVASGESEHAEDQRDYRPCGRPMAGCVDRRGVEGIAHYWSLPCTATSNSTFSGSVLACLGGRGFTMPIPLALVCRIAASTPLAICTSVAVTNS